MSKIEIRSYLFSKSTKRVFVYVVIRLIQLFT